MDWLNDTPWQPIVLVLLAGVLHSSFQTSISVLTLVAHHTLGMGHSNSKLLNRGLAYIAGVAFATLTLVLSLFYITNSYSHSSYAWWTTVAIIVGTTGFFALGFALQPKPGTVLKWMPRSLADYLHKRSKKTQQPVEAFALGIMTFIAELPFALAPLLAVSLTASLKAGDATLLIPLYIAIVILPLLIMLGAIGGGARISQIQKWREENKFFLQTSGAIGLILLSVLLLLTYWELT